MQFGSTPPPDPEADSAIDHLGRPGKEQKPIRERRPERGTRKRNVSFNGMHRRRKRRIDW